MADKKHDADQPDLKLNMFALAGSLAFGHWLTALMCLYPSCLLLVVGLCFGVLFKWRTRRVWQATVLLMWGIFFWFFMLFDIFQRPE